MTQRLNYAQQSPELFKKLADLSMALKDSVIEQKIHDLVQIRASQINGCGFCLDMHVKEAKIHGESELRLYHIAIWRESNLFVPARARRTCLDRSFNEAARRRYPRRTLRAGARPAFGEGNLGPDLLDHGHQCLEPRQRRLQERARFR
ncbi:AhpD family alkylhydroperoxidase [Sinorhizobium fredii]